MKIFYGIIHSSTFKNRVNYILNSWGMNQNIKFFSDYESSNCIKLTVRNDFFSDIIKIFKGIKQNYSEFDWLVICKDSTFINTKNLENFLQKENCSEAKCFGRLISYDSYLYFDISAGIVISKKAIELLQNADLTEENQTVDFILSKNIDKCNIKKVNSFLFNYQHPESINIKNVQSYISFGYVDETTMYELMNPKIKIIYNIERSIFTDLKDEHLIKKINNDSNKLINSLIYLWEIYKNYDWFVIYDENTKNIDLEKILTKYSCHDNIIGRNLYGASYIISNKTLELMYYYGLRNLDKDNLIENVIRTCNPEKM